MDKNKKDQNDAIVNVRHNTFGFIMFWVALLLLLINQVSYDMGLIDPHLTFMWYISGGLLLGLGALFTIRFASIFIRIWGDKSNGSTRQ